MSHPGSFRAFADIRVRKMLDTERNMKKITISFTKQLREQFVQSAGSIF